MDIDRTLLKDLEESLLTSWHTIVGDSFEARGVQDWLRLAGMKIENCLAQHLLKSRTTYRGPILAYVSAESIIIGSRVHPVSSEILAPDLLHLFIDGQTLRRVQKESGESLWPLIQSNYLIRKDEPDFLQLYNLFKNEGSGQTLFPGTWKRTEIIKSIVDLNEVLSSRDVSREKQLFYKNFLQSIFDAVDNTCVLIVSAARVPDPTGVSSGRGISTFLWLLIPKLHHTQYGPLVQLVESAMQIVRDVFVLNENWRYAVTQGRFELSNAIYHQAGGLLLELWNEIESKESYQATLVWHLLQLVNIVTHREFGESPSLLVAVDAIKRSPSTQKYFENLISLALGHSMRRMAYSNAGSPGVAKLLVDKYRELAESRDPILDLRKYIGVKLNLSERPHPRCFEQHFLIAFHHCVWQAGYHAILSRRTTRFRKCLVINVREDYVEILNRNYPLSTKARSRDSVFFEQISRACNQLVSIRPPVQLESNWWQTLIEFPLSNRDAE